MSDNFNPADVGKGPKKDLPAEMKTVEGLVNHLEDYIRRVFAEKPDCDWAPMFVAVCRNGDIVPILAPQVGDPDAKSEILDNLRLQFEMWNVERYVVGMEAWVSFDNLTENGRFVPPSENPNRGEGIMISAVDKRGRVAGRLLRMHRGPDRKVSDLTKEYDADPGQLQLAGRFMDLLVPKELAEKRAGDVEMHARLDMLMTTAEEALAHHNAPPAEQERLQKIALEILRAHSDVQRAREPELREAAFRKMAGHLVSYDALMEKARLRYGDEFLQKYLDAKIQRGEA